MTNNKVIVDENGKESVIANRADGLAVARIKDIGIKQIIISAETNSVVKNRAEKNISNNMQKFERKIILRFLFNLPVFYDKINYYSHYYSIIY